METYTDKVIRLLENYQELQKKIQGIKDPEELRVNDDYRALINLESELKKYTLNGNEIIKIYRDVKNIAKQNYNLQEERYTSKINELEEVVSNLKNSKNNLRDLIRDSKNFFNGEIVKEIKKEY